MSAGSNAKAKGEQVVGAAVDRLMRAVALETVSRVMLRTPVDTGRARANWNVTMDAPDTDTNDDTDWQGKLGGNQGFVGEAEFAGGRSLFLSNGQPYIERLEAGYSKQAPAGMVELTMAEMSAFVESLTSTGGGDDGK